ncbi:MFS transporter [Tepidiforma sp.]|uniref:MFS transporter n=1 Tax=Tepidiforma sp. TaxID=2682230 RepID=UPI002626CB9A|nr:MFS transporter [Tepidiforma sp.]MCX7618606.1 MFS transporter [Tepidiforma sp.]
MLELPAEPAQGRGPFASLQHQQFRWLFASNIAFFFAMNGQFIVRSVLAYRLTGSEFALGLINLVVAIPMLLVSPFGGVIADRVEKRRLIMTGQAVLVASELAVFALLVLGRLEFWHLLAVVFVMGCTFPFIMPARQAIVANIVGRQGMASAMALQMGGMNAARVVGPVFAGLIIAVFGVRWVYAMAVTLYALAFFAMAHVSKSPPADGAGSRPVLAELVGGLRYVSTDPPVRALLVLSIIPILLAMPFQALLVVFADDTWHVGAGGLGVLQAAAGLGGIAGSFWVAFASESPRKLRLMMSTLLAFAGSLLLFSLSPWFLLAIPLVFAADVFASAFTTTVNTLIQVLIPNEVRGRVMSIMMMTFGLTPLGTVPVSALAEALGAPAAVAIASLVTMALSLAMLLASGSLRRIDGTVAKALAEERAAPFAPGRGPVAAPGAAWKAGRAPADAG